MLSKVKQYSEKAKKSTPKIVKAFVQDTLIICKIQFFSLVALVLEPFLRGYQPSEQLALFLYQDKLDILYVLVSWFLNQVILASATTPKKNLNVEKNGRNNGRKELVFCKR